MKKPSSNFSRKIYQAAMPLWYHTGILRSHLSRDVMQTCESSSGFRGGILLSFPRENSLNSFILKQDIWGNRRALHSRGSRWSSLGLQGTFSWLAFVFVWFWLWVIPVMFFVLQSHKNDIFILEGAINREAGMELHNAPDEFILCSSAGIQSPKVFRGQSSAGSPSIKDHLQLPSPF